MDGKEEERAAGKVRKIKKKKSIDGFKKRHI